MPKLAEIDFVTNEGLPFSIPWAKRGDGLATFVSRFKYYFQRRGDFYFLVAASPDNEILGFILWNSPGVNTDDWDPQFPEGTKVDFFPKYLGQISKEIKKLGVEGLYGEPCL